MSESAIYFALPEAKRTLPWRVSLLALQGIVNRRGPRLQFNTGTLSDWARADAHRRALNVKEWNLRAKSVRSRDRLLRAFREDLRGAVLYDPKLDATRWVAVTLAGLEDLLPLTPGQLRQMPWKPDVVHDLRRFNWASAADAYGWAIRELMPRCHRRLAFNAGQSHDDVDFGYDLGVITALDYAVRHRGFVFNLAPVARPDCYFKRKVSGYPEDVRLFRRIFRRLEAPAAIYGWAEPEWKHTTLINRYNHYLMCGRSANLSYHEAIATGRRKLRFRQSRSPLRKARLDAKCYVAFLISEGDTHRVTASFFMGGWTDPQRGKLPMNWGLNPREVKHMPAHVHHYYRTATPNDFFYAGVGGAGYVFMNKLPDPQPYIDFAAPHLRAGDVRVVELWSNGQPDYDAYTDYARRARLDGIVHLGWKKQTVRHLPDGTPVVFMPAPLVHYYGTPAQIAERIRAAADRQGDPSFVCVYRSPRKDVVTQCRRIMRELDPERFIPVRLDDMMRLARQAGKK